MIIRHPQHPNHLSQDLDSISRTFLEHFALVRFSLNSCSRNRILLLSSHVCWIQNFELVPNSHSNHVHPKSKLPYNKKLHGTMQSRQRDQILWLLLTILSKYHCSCHSRPLLVLLVILAHVLVNSGLFGYSSYFCYLLIFT